MEAMITLVGFLGAGKTTVLKALLESYLNASWDPYVILNDYENALLDAQQLDARLGASQLRPLNGSCICCSGIAELREFVNRIPARARGITLIEANGTTNACDLMGFLGVGIDRRFLPPVQISVVDVKNWQQRGVNNELEASQVQVSSLIALSHTEEASAARMAAVREQLHKLNPSASIVSTNELHIERLPALQPSPNRGRKIEHEKSHWASCSVDLPTLPDETCIHEICAQLPASILRIKGFTAIGGQSGRTYFERLADGKVLIRPFRGSALTAPKLLTVGPGSDPKVLEAAIASSLEAAVSRAR